ncbi:MAG: dTMP kinase [Candidatus Delongbacteria bacterium]|nr:dTMP kinase [Candidatus Delongbacteria bacterium]
MIISFEGLDGCGKSTQISMLKKLLDGSGYRTEVLREPGGDPICEKIREILLDKKNLNMCNTTELLLYIASRAQLVKSGIAPLIEQGVIVILDRFLDSTTAYQGYGRKLDLLTVKMLNELATDSGRFVPDLTFFLDMDPEISMKRMHSRGEEINRMESNNADFFTDIRKGFLEIASEEPERVKVIDGTQDIDSVHSAVKKILKERKII